MMINDCVKRLEREHLDAGTLLWLLASAASVFRGSETLRAPALLARHYYHWFRPEACTLLHRLDQALAKEISCQSVIDLVVSTE